MGADINAQFKAILNVDLFDTSIYSKDNVDKKYGINIVAPTDTTVQADTLVTQNMRVLKEKCQQVYECIARLLLNNMLSGAEIYGKDIKANR